MKAHDLLPDGVERAIFNGVDVRKGTVGAFLANARRWRDAATGAAARSELEAEMALALPALSALGLFDEFTLRDPALAGWIAQRMPR